MEMITTKRPICSCFPIDGRHISKADEQKEEVNEHEQQPQDYIIP